MAPMCVVICYLLMTPGTGSRYGNNQVTPSHSDFKITHKFRLVQDSFYRGIKILMNMFTLTILTCED